MNAIDRYVEDVMRHIAPGIPDRHRIEEDLRMHLAERIEAEGDRSRALDRMGDPEEVARSFLDAIDPPLATAGDRLGAFLLDAGICAVLLMLASLVVAAILDPSGTESVSALEGVQVFLLATVFIAPALLYFPVLEERFGQTPGKRLFDIYVAKESGERAGLGATVVRRLSLLFEIWPIDALFVFFTEKRQRAFDILAKTIVVDGGEKRFAAWGWVLAPWIAFAGLAAIMVAIT
ncbi:MAG: RDD family protein [Gemmatimonadota bacterium]|nr:RDD family protein [Gemmatimonadota bacterium]